MTPQTTALIALRVSTPEQLKNFSIETQRHRCLAYAETHRLTVPSDGVAIDDETGATIYRDDFQKILRRLRAGDAKHLIVFVLDRLTREPADFLPLRKELHAIGITIHVAREDRALSKDPLDDLPDDVRVVIAKHERAVFRERSMRGRAAKIASGRVPGNGPPPFGFQYTGHKRDRQLVINEAEADIVRLMARWFVLGDGERPPMSVVEIGRHLTELHIPTRADTLGRAKKLRGPGEWDFRMVSSILRDTTLAGTFYANRIQRLDKKHTRLRPREEWTAIPVPALLDVDLFEAVQRKLDLGQAHATRNTRRWYLLRCRVRCSCGYALCGFGTPSSDKRYYRCISRGEGRAACGMPYIPTNLLDTRVWRWLNHEALDDAQLLARIEREQQRGRDTDYTASTARRAELDTKLRANAAAEQQLLAEAIRGRFSTVAIDNELARLAAEKQRLESDRAALGTVPAIPQLTDPVAQDLRTYAAVIREGLTDMTPTEQRRAIDMLDVRLVLSQQHGQIVANATCLLRLESARILIAKRTQSSLRSS